MTILCIPAFRITSANVVDKGHELLLVVGTAKIELVSLAQTAT